MLQKAKITLATGDSFIDGEDSTIQELAEYDIAVDDQSTTNPDDDIEEIDASEEQYDIDPDDASACDVSSCSENEESQLTTPSKAVPTEGIAHTLVKVDKSPEYTVVAQALVTEAFRAKVEAHRNIAPSVVPVAREEESDEDEFNYYPDKAGPSQEDDELKKYFDGAWPLSKKGNPLKWWKTHQSEFPRLAMVARDVLACAGSSAMVERTFSAAADVSATASRPKFQQPCSLTNQITATPTLISSTWKRMALVKSDKFNMDTQVSKVPITTTKAKILPSPSKANLI
ncbi:hypothetical protein PtB15_9B428 [Puccinia triticina]|nr:hypothetical protein PtB15_9B428 [Puccinia triticina]